MKMEGSCNLAEKTNISVRRIFSIIQQAFGTLADKAGAWVG